MQNNFDKEKKALSYILEKPLAKRYNIWMKLNSVFRIDLDWRQGV